MGFVGNYVRNLAGMCVGREPTRPLMFSYYVTHRCHLNCRYCSDGQRSARASLPVPLLELNQKYPEFVTLTSYIEHLDQAIAEGGVGNCRTGRVLMNIDHRGDVARCTERLDEPVGNILTDDVRQIRRRLWKLTDTQACAECWTSCRGFAESMFMRPRLRQYREFYHSVRPH